MISRVYLRCRACGRVTLAKFQVGWLDAMPFAIACNNCRAVIRGRLIQDQIEVRLSLKLENADEVENLPSTETPTQEIECSGELPVRRYVNGKLGTMRPSPFILAWQSMGNERYQQFKGNILKYLEFMKLKMPNFVTLADLYVAGDYGKVREMLSNYFGVGNRTENISDVVSDFYDLISKITQFLLPPKHYLTTTEPLLRHFGQSIRANNQERIKFVEYLYEKVDLIKTEIDGLILLMRFLGNFDYFLPVICLSYWPEHKVKRPLGSEYLITTTDIETIKQLYADSFEWICRSLPILVGAENMRRRGSFDSMPSIQQSGQRQLKSLSDFADADSGIKRQLLVETNAFRDRFSPILDNRLRNAINHYKTRLDPVRQTIEYFPFKGIKRAKESRTTYLIDLTDITYRQFATIHDLLYIIGAVHCYKNE